MNAYAEYFQPEILSRIGGLELRARRVVEGYVSGMHKSPYKGFSVEFANHRPYVPGDDIRHLDWRVYAKADRFFIKEYEEETNMRVHLLLDCSGSMAYPEHPGTGRMTKWMYASTAAMSLAYLLTNQQDGVGLTLFDQGLRRQLPVSSNAQTLHQLAVTIEANTPSGATDPRPLFHHAAGRFPPRGMIVLLSDLLTDLDPLIGGLQRLRFAGHELVVMHVLDHDELEFPFEDRTLFEAMETPGLEILADPQSLRASYRQSVQRFITRVRGACLNDGIEYELFSTRDPLNVTLTRFLAARNRRRRASA